MSAVLLAALAVAGCSADTQARIGGPVSLSPQQVAATPTAPPPPPEALADVMYRLADPAVPGAEKLALVQDSAPPDAAVFDRFAAALRDSGFAPVTFTATDVRWADPAPAAAGTPEPRVLATITVASGTAPEETASDDSTASEEPGDFRFPMAFIAGPSGWALTRDTAEMLLAFGTG